jgi:tetratricopeptide (TPR) repeat protein
MNGGRMRMARAFALLATDATSGPNLEKAMEALEKAASADQRRTQPFVRGLSALRLAIAQRQKAFLNLSQEHDFSGYALALSGLRRLLQDQNGLRPTTEQKAQIHTFAAVDLLAVFMHLRVCDSCIDSADQIADNWLYNGVDLDVSAFAGRPRGKGSLRLLLAAEDSLGKARELNPRNELAWYYKLKTKGLVFAQDDGSKGDTGAIRREAAELAQRYEQQYEQIALTDLFRALNLAWCEVVLHSVRMQCVYDPTQAIDVRIPAIQSILNARKEALGRFRAMCERLNDDIIEPVEKFKKTIYSELFEAEVGVPEWPQLSEQVMLLDGLLLHGDIQDHLHAHDGE